jgi:hypothetical protein
LLQHPIAIELEQSQTCVDQLQSHCLLNPHVSSVVMTQAPLEQQLLVMV